MGSRDAGSEINAAVNNATLTVGLGEVLDKLTGAHHVDLVISHTRLLQGSHLRDDLVE